MFRRIILLSAVLLLFGAAACKKTKPVEPPKVVPAEHFFGTLRLSVDDSDLGKEVYFYVETTFQGANGFSTDISLDEGEYRVTAATPVNTEEAAFYVLTKRVKITSGKTNEVHFNLPDAAPSPEDSEQDLNEPGYVSGGCGSGNGSDYVERSRAIRAEVGSNLSRAQNDSLYAHLSAVSYSFQSQPPALGRITVQNVPVMDLDKGSASEINLELVPAQIRHLTSWLESQKYDLGKMEQDTETAASVLARIIQEAENCGEQDLWRAATVEKSYADNLAEQVKAFRKQFRTTMTSIVDAVEQAAQNTGAR